MLVSAERLAEEEAIEVCRVDENKQVPVSIVPSPEDIFVLMVIETCCREIGLRTELIEKLIDDPAFKLEENPLVIKRVLVELVKAQLREELMPDIEVHETAAGLLIIGI